MVARTCHIFYVVRTLAGLLETETKSVKCMQCNLYNTPWCRVLLEKLTGLQLVKKFPAYHETRRFITALASVHHLSLSWASPIQSIYPHLTSWRSILILSTHLRLGLPRVSFPPVSPPRTYTPSSPHPYAPHAQPISFLSILSPAQYWVMSTNHLAPRYAVSSTLLIGGRSSIRKLRTRHALVTGTHYMFKIQFLKFLT